MYWPRNLQYSTAEAVWAWWRACVLTGCQRGEKLSWRGEGRQCTQWEGVSQTAGSAAPPTRTWPERKKESVSLWKLSCNNAGAHSSHALSNHCSLAQDAQARTIHLNTHHPTCWAKCCYWLQLVNFDKLQAGIRLSPTAETVFSASFVCVCALITLCSAGCKDVLLCFSALSDVDLLQLLKPRDDALHVVVYGLFNVIQYGLIYRESTSKGLSSHSVKCVYSHLRQITQ